MDEVLGALAGEFGDLSLVSAVQLTVRLLIAGLLGGVLGWERSQAGKAAGMRTHILVAVGSAAFIAVPQQAGLSGDGIARILQGLLAGIGFLGAGCIIRRETEGQIKGLTTAAGIWLTAAVGMASGMGREASALVLGLFGWFTLSSLGRWEHYISGGQDRDRPDNERVP